jgi:hypothetical protein
LYDNSELDAAGIDGIRGSVRNGAICPQRRPAAMDRIQHRVGPDDVQVGVLLSGETCKRQIFRSR